MKLRLAMLLVTICSVNGSAGVLDDLRKIPATQYELGKLQLEIAAFFMIDNLKGERVGDTYFEIENFHVEEKEGKLLFVATLEGYAENMSQVVCNSLNDHFKSDDVIGKIPRQIWPNLTEEQYSQLHDEFLITTILQSKENESFVIQCD